MDRVVGALVEQIAERRAGDERRDGRATVAAVEPDQRGRERGEPVDEREEERALRQRRDQSLAVARLRVMVAVDEKIRDAPRARVLRQVQPKAMQRVFEQRPEQHTRERRGDDQRRTGVGVREEQRDDHWRVDERRQPRWCAPLHLAVATCWATSGAPHYHRFNEVHLHHAECACYWLDQL